MFDVTTVAEEELDVCEAESLLEDDESLEMRRSTVAGFFADNEIIEGIDMI